MHEVIVQDFGGGARLVHFSITAVGCDYRQDQFRRMSETGAMTHSELITDKWSRIFFSQSHENPLFLADMQTASGGNTAGLRYKRLSDKSVQIKVEEEKSKDRETSHTTEIVGYFVLPSELR